MVKSSTSSILFPGEKSPNSAKFLELKLVSLDLKEKKRKFRLKLMMTKLGAKKKNPLLTTLCFIYCRDKYNFGGESGGGEEEGGRATAASSSYDITESRISGLQPIRSPYIWNISPSFVTSSFMTIRHMGESECRL